jgi:(p)ppGpp synthase/HD superfamily hydrolase
MTTTHTAPHVYIDRAPWVFEAKSLAERKHYGQLRRDGLTPYYVHLAAVAHKLRAESDEVVAAAWLHDVLEDTDTLPSQLLGRGIPADVVAAVEAMTKRKGVSYPEYLKGVKANPIAAKVKVADMLHNLSDSPTEKQIGKYARGLLYLIFGETP